MFPFVGCTDLSFGFLGTGDTFAMVLAVVALLIGNILGLRTPTKVPEMAVGWVWVIVVPSNFAFQGRTDESSKHQPGDANFPLSAINAVKPDRNEMVVRRWSKELLPSHSDASPTCITKSGQGFNPSIGGNFVLGKAGDWQPTLGLARIVYGRHQAPRYRWLKGKRGFRGIASGKLGPRRGTSQYPLLYRPRLGKPMTRPVAQGRPRLVANASRWI